MNNESMVPIPIRTSSRRQRRRDFSPQAQHDAKLEQVRKSTPDVSIKTGAPTPFDTHTDSIYCSPKYRPPQNESKRSLRRIRTSGSLHAKDSLANGGSLGRKFRFFPATNVDSKKVIYPGPTCTTSSVNKAEPRFLPAGCPTIPDTPRQSELDSKCSYQTRLQSHSHSKASKRTPDEDEPRQNSENSPANTSVIRPTKKCFQGFPLIEISIPSYKLGPLCFNNPGFPYLQNPSLNTSDTDISQEIVSRDPKRANLTRPASKIHTERQNKSSSVKPLNDARSTQFNSLPSRLPAPKGFNQMNIKSLCDDPSIVRYSTNRRIKAATSARLVVEITSPKVIDYDFLSDFFLTFRSFLKTSDLMHMLISRLKWALLRVDAIGIVVRVRTFVAIRHWILNYFDDDFAMDRDLRCSYCALLNELTVQMSIFFSQSQVHLKILSELKKYWRKICSIYWETSDDDSDASVMDPIFPGGHINSQSSFTSQHIREKYPEKSVKSERGAVEHDFLDPERMSKNKDLVTDNFKHFNSEKFTLVINSSNLSTQNDLPPSPKSIKSEELIIRRPSARRRAARNFSLPDAQVWASNSIDKSSKVAQQHTTNTWSHESAQKLEMKTKIHVGKFPYQGSLVRGNISPHQTSRALLNEKEVTPLSKKSLGGVLRVLRNKKGQELASSPNDQRCLAHIPQLCFKSSLPNQLSEKSSKQQDRSEVISINFPMRFDLLGMEVAKAFKQIIEEEKDVEVSNCNFCRPKSCQTHNYDPHSGETKLSQNRSTFCSSLCNDNVTETSRTPRMTAITDCLLPDPLALSHYQTSNGPTPPNTPPNLILDFPRCGSQLSGIDARKQSLSTDEAPSLIVDSYPSAADDASLRFSTEASSDLRFSYEMEVTPCRNNPSCSGISRWTGECNSFGNSTSSETAEFQRLEHLSSLVSASLLVRPLRRRPGGYLRQGMNYPDDINIDPHSQPASPQLDQTSHYRSSYFSDQGSSEDIDVLSRAYSIPNRRNGAFSPKIRLEPRTRTPTSSPSTSSPYNSRSSMQLPFQKEVQMLALIPDDDEDDGGVESALLKLEGKIPERSPVKQYRVIQAPDSPHTYDSFDIDTLRPELSVSYKERQQNNRERAIGITPLKAPAPLKTYRPKQTTKKNNSNIKSYQPQGMKKVNLSPLPTQHMKSYKSTNLSPSESVYQISDLPSQGQYSCPQTPITQDFSDSISTTSARKNLNFVSQDDLDSVAESINLNPQHRIGSTSKESFLFPENEQKSKVSLVSDNRNPGLNLNSNDSATKKDTNSFPIICATEPKKESKLSPGVGCFNKQTPSAVISSKTNPIKDVPLLPSDKTFTWSRGATPNMNPLKLHLLSKSPAEISGHLPFILAFHSDILAQQFTLVERDVVGEIYWKDLIEINWAENSNEFKSWVEILRSQDSPRGVEVVVSRFNLVVKWVISECVLTQDLNERVNCLIKFIHLAANCRKYRNFATSAQITMALTSQVISSLSNTWAQVSKIDTQIFKDLKALFTSSNEFHQLRAEMEGCGIDQGCIPVIGVYTNDLLVIEEEPSRIPYKTINESLINFEKFRASATIVKTLLRLLDSSQRYKFSPIEGIFERCLWIATLSDTEILKHRNMIQNG